VPGVGWILLIDAASGYSHPVLLRSSMVTVPDVLRYLFGGAGIFLFIIDSRTLFSRNQNMGHGTDPGPQRHGLCATLLLIFVLKERQV
jgi:hypothetical protein